MSSSKKTASKVYCERTQGAGIPASVRPPASPLKPASAALRRKPSLGTDKKPSLSAAEETYQKKSSSAVPGETTPSSHGLWTRWTLFLSTLLQAANARAHALSVGARCHFALFAGATRRHLLAGRAAGAAAVAEAVVFLAGEPGTERREALAAAWARFETHYWAVRERLSEACARARATALAAKSRTRALAREAHDRMGAHTVQLAANAAVLLALLALLVVLGVTLPCFLPSGARVPESANAELAPTATSAPSSALGQSLDAPSAQRASERVRVARAWMAAGRFAEARAVLEEEIRGPMQSSGLNPIGNVSRSEVLTDLGASMVYTDNLQEGIEVLLAGMSGHLNANALNALGFAYSQLGDLSAAQQVLRTSVQFRPQSARAWTNLGALALSAGEFAKADAAFYYAHEFAPEEAARDANLENNIKVLHNLASGRVDFPDTTAPGVEMVYELPAGEE